MNPCTALAEYPLDQQSQSMLDVIAESGYVPDGEAFSVEAISAALRGRSDLVRAWLQYSEDQRISQGFFFESVAGCWVVGYATADGVVSQESFEDEFVACALFVKKKADALHEYWRARPWYPDTRPG